MLNQIWSSLSGDGQQELTSEEAKQYLGSFRRSSTMRWLLMFICLAGVLRPQPLYARNFDVEIHKAGLVCGGTKFFTKSEFIRLAPVSQTITAIFKGNKLAALVDLRQTRILYPFELGTIRGLASFVSDWQCRKTRNGHVLVLGYTCPLDLREAVPQALCSSTGEWTRYIALDGSLLDQGFSFDDIRYDKLRSALGYDVNPSHAVDDGPFISIH